MSVLPVVPVACCVWKCRYPFQLHRVVRCPVINTEDAWMYEDGQDEVGEWLDPMYEDG